MIITSKCVRSSRGYQVSNHYVLIRHGQYSHRKEYLTPIGREQIMYTAQRLIDWNFPIREIITSTRPRSIESSEIIRETMQKAWNIRKDPLLDEAQPTIAQITNENVCTEKVENRFYSFR